jgi:F0F1-type ATP synthase assembly protein I
MAFRKLTQSLNKPKTSNLATGIALGLTIGTGIGAAIGAATNTIAISISVGVACGLAIGASAGFLIDNRKKKDGNTTVQETYKKFRYTMTFNKINRFS